MLNIALMNKRLTSLAVPFPRLLGARLAIALAILFFAGVAQAAEIYVDGVACQLSDAITAANTDEAVFGCSAGAGADTLILTRDISLQLGELPSVTSDITIQRVEIVAQEVDCGERQEEPPPPNTPTPPAQNNPPPSNTPAPPPTNTPAPPPTNTPAPPPSNTPVSPPTNTPAPPPTNTPAAPPSYTPVSPGDPPPDDPPADPPPDDPPPDDPPADTPPDDPPAGTPPDDPPSIGTPPGSATATATTSATPTNPELTLTATSTGKPPETSEHYARGIPSHCLHIVARGDTLYRIALEHEMTVSEISRVNNLLSDDRLLEGQELIIPYANCIRFAPALRKAG